uniref:Uncharacterized protein n=1 Tax=Tanacetum cinerariifolium TaxID=118510 RepID=A0A6L2NSH5_TANCI|nr:hypothetical protein [Tanacetum cinerariifolium]
MDVKIAFKWQAQRRDQQIRRIYQLDTTYRPFHSEQRIDLYSLNNEVIFFYNGIDVPTRQIVNSKGALPSKTIADAKIDIQEMAEYSQKWHNGTSSEARSTETSDGLADIQA